MLEAAIALDIVLGRWLEAAVIDVVPADVQLLDGQLLVDESVLTGESLTAEKRPGATAFSGSNIHRGELSLCMECRARSMFQE